MIIKRVWYPLLVIALLAPSVDAADASGRWKGTWDTNGSTRRSSHHGTLRVRLKSEGNGTYRGLFAGRFAVVIPYVYRAKVYQHGNRLISTKRLGPLGEYRMVLTQQSGQLGGYWTAAGESGTIRLRRR